MEEMIIKIMSYFSFFDYPPTAKEIYCFLKTKTTKEKLQQQLQKLVSKRKVNKINNRYTLGGHGIKISNIKYQISKIINYLKRQEISEEKINKTQLYIKILSFFPQIKLVGLSGTIAMMNADKKDDIDLFVVTARNRLWTGRLIALILAQVLGIRRKWIQIDQRMENRGQKTDLSEKTRDKVCLNLFFDESNLGVPDFKKTEYVAHEVLQMKPLISKGDIYNRFLGVNRWVFKLFPNAKNKSETPNPKLQMVRQAHHRQQSQGINPKSQTLNYKRLEFKDLNLFGVSNFEFNIFNWIEYLLRKLQLYFINKHKTNEIITNTQLWFHPVDFEREILKFK
jgi:predicted nucleotidyltransferase